MESRSSLRFSRTQSTSRSGVPLNAPRHRPTLIEHLDVAGLGYYQARLFLLLCFLPDTSMVYKSE
jgi:hypothetical protein